MSKLIKLGASVLLSFSFSYASTPAEVEAFVKSGADYCKKVGVETCLNEFNNNDGKFINGDLYIFAEDFNGVITAHPKKPIKGKNLFRYKDKAGNQLFKEFIDKVKADGSGWVDYVWAHPATGKQTPKTSFVIGIGNDNLIGAGMYK